MDYKKISIVFFAVVVRTGHRYVLKCALYAMPPLRLVLHAFYNNTILV